MMDQPIEVKEFSAESKIDWNLTVLAKSDWERNFIVMSEEVNFKEAEAKWSLQLSSCSWGTNNIFVVSRFFLQKINFDNNAKFKFEILLKDGTILSSPLFTVMNPTFEYQMQQYISIQEGDMLEITPKVTFFTLKFYKEIPPFAKKGLNDALEAMNKNKEAEDVKLAFKALTNAVEAMAYAKDAQYDPEFQLFDKKFEMEIQEALMYAQESDSDDQSSSDSQSSSDPQSDSQTDTDDAHSDIHECQISQGVQFNVLELLIGTKNAQKEAQASQIAQESPIEPEEVKNTPQEGQNAENSSIEPQGSLNDTLVDLSDQDDQLDAEVSEINSQKDAQDTYKAFKAFNHSLQAMIFADDANTIVSAFKDLLKAAENPTVAEKLSQEAEKAKKNFESTKKDVVEPQTDADVADFDHCLDAVHEGPKAQEDTSEDDYDHCSDVDAPKNSQVMPDAAQIEARLARIAQGIQKEAIKTRHSANILQNDMSDDDFDHCTENGAADKIYRSEAPVKVHCHEGNCSKQSEKIEENNASSYSIEIPNIGKIVFPTSDPAQLELLNYISKIYLENMKMIADASAALLIFAAQHKNETMLDDCLATLMAQINLKNFCQIWQVGEKLKLEDLKDKALRYAMENSFKAWYDQNISSDLMRDFVKIEKKFLK